MKVLSVFKHEPISRNLVRRPLNNKKQISNHQITKKQALKKEDSKTVIEVTSKIDRPSDIAKNNPNDSNTTEKLKSVLKMGAFNFSDKEKNVLSKILNS